MQRTKERDGRSKGGKERQREGVKQGKRDKGKKGDTHSASVTQGW